MGYLCRSAIDERIDEIVDRHDARMLVGHEINGEGRATFNVLVVDRVVPIYVSTRMSKAKLLAAFDEIDALCRMAKARQALPPAPRSTTSEPLTLRP